MRILGIDPGLAIVGYAVLDHKGNQLLPIEYGSIQTKAGLSLPLRIKQIYEACQQIIHTYQPERVAVEKLFFNRNVTTAFSVGQARGVVLLAAEQAGIEVTEYTPLEVKMAVVGYGQAEKIQVQRMVQMLLGLKSMPKPDDVADALAIAICEAHAGGMKRGITQ